MSTVLFEAVARTDTGKGASRRLRRLNKVPAIIYGGTKKPSMLSVAQNVLAKALESESIYSSVFDITVDGKKEHVILKDLQRHPYKPIIMHLDLQRVSSKDVLVKVVPLHFLNEETAKGVKAGGIITHVETQVEVRCKAKDLPEFIEVDMGAVELDQSVHLSEIKLPKGVELTADLSDSAHDQPIAAIHIPKKEVIEEPAEEETSEEEASGDDESSNEDSNEQDSK